MEKNYLLPFILSLCFNIFLVIIHLLQRNDKRKELKSKLTEEMIAINTLGIQYPKIKYLYKTKHEIASLPKIKRDEKARIVSFAYRYLNVLSKIDDYYRIVKHLSDNTKLIDFINNNNMTLWDKLKYGDPRYLRDWLVFYRKTFNKKTMGFKIMKKIVSTDSINETGDYSTEFAKFVRVLFQIEENLN